MDFIKDLAQANEKFSKPIIPFNRYVTDLREIASKNKAQAVNYVSAKDRKEALQKKLEITTDKATKARTELELQRILDTEPDYATLNKPLYGSLD